MAGAMRIIVTGGNTGIGFEAARQLLQRGHHVIITSRDASRAQKAVEALQPVAKANSASIDSALLDLASFSSVRTCAAQLLSRHPKVDILLCNAGVWSRAGGNEPLKLTDDGQETTLQVNHLGHFLFVHLLLPALLATPSARVVVVSSELHRTAKATTTVGGGGGGAATAPPALPLASPEWLPRLSKAAEALPPHPSGFQLYCISKLYNLWFVYRLATLLPPTVKVNTVTPGWVPGTALGRDMPWLARLAYQYLFPLLPGTTSVAEGGRRVVAACLGGAEGELAEGPAYFSRGVATESSPESRDAAAAERLWALSEAAVGLEERYVPAATAPMKPAPVGSAAAPAAEPAP